MFEYTYTNQGWTRLHSPVQPWFWFSWVWNSLMLNGATSLPSHWDSYRQPTRSVPKVKASWPDTGVNFYIKAQTLEYKGHFITFSTTSWSAFNAPTSRSLLSIRILIKNQLAWSKKLTSHTHKQTHMLLTANSTAVLGKFILHEVSI